MGMQGVVQGGGQERGSANPLYVNNGDSRERSGSREEEGQERGGFLTWQAAVGEVFADYLNVTFERDVFETQVVRALLPYLDRLGASKSVKDGHLGSFPAVFSLPEAGGSFRLSIRGKVGIVSASGGALAALRTARLFGDYLGALASFPHRVSMLHVTQDFVVAQPGAVIQEVRARGYAGDLALTRKAIRGDQVKCVFGMRPDGQESGTVYLGNRANADVWGKVYDKQLERIERGAADPGPLVRVEIALQSDVGCTLKDAQQPAAVFWHYGAQLCGGRPPGVPSWESHGEGFMLPSSECRIKPKDRVAMLLGVSSDVARILAIARAEVGSDDPGEVFEWLRPLLVDRLRLRDEIR